MKSQNMADKAWEETLKDHLANREDVELSKRSFYLGFVKCSAFIKPLEQALIAVKRHGIHHYSDCTNCDYEDNECDCGAEKVEKIVIDALKELTEGIEECKKQV